MERYLVIQTSATEMPYCNGVSRVKSFATRDEAMECVARVVTEDYAEYCGIAMMPGDAFDTDGNPFRGRLKYADHAFLPDGLGAWCRGNTDRWERIETYLLTEDGRCREL